MKQFCETMFPGYRGTYFTAAPVKLILEKLGHKFSRSVKRDGRYDGFGFQGAVRLMIRERSDEQDRSDQAEMARLKRKDGYWHDKYIEMKKFKAIEEIDRLKATIRSLQGKIQSLQQEIELKRKRVAMVKSLSSGRVGKCRGKCSGILNSC